MSLYIWDRLKLEIYDKWKKIWLENHPSDIGEYSWDYLFTGGKQIRPKLFCELWHYLSPDSKILGELAFAIECIHLSSIVIDDTPWMDNASERRGKKTIHTVYTPKKALLISYDLIDIVCYIWKTNKPENIDLNTWDNLLKSKLQRLMVGQWYDLDKKGSLVELASLKTGVLFELVCETIALCTDLDRNFWKLWGNNLGILFQWIDDYIDMEEDKQQNNRNAFNESYNSILNNYSILWHDIRKKIGNQWFNTSFGKYMEYYFAEKINISNIHNNYTSLYDIIEYPNNIIIPELENTQNTEKNKPKYYFNFIDGKQIIKHIWNNIEDLSVNNTKHNLWKLDESEWNIPNM